MADPNKGYDPTTSYGIAKPLAAPSGSTTPAAKTTPGITSVLTPDQINQQATSSVDSDIASQIAPLTSQLTGIQGSEDTAMGDLSSMFGSILPYAKQAANAVGTAYDDAETQQQQIFTAAQMQLNQLKQSQAQKAQALAQQIGGPVSIDEFTSQLPQQEQSLVNTGAGQMLHTLGYGMADVSEANAFAGQVLPLVQTEQTARLRDYFENQKKTINDQIASIKSQRGAQINKAKNDLLVQERQYALDKTNAALEAVKEKHNWYATQQTVKDDQSRLRIAQRQADLQARQTAASIAATKASTQIQQRTLTDREKQMAQQAGITDQEFKLRKQQLQASTKYNTQRLAMAQQQQWGQLLDQAISPTPGKSVTTTVKVPVTEIQAMKDHSAYQDGTSKTGYSKLVKVTQTPATNPITDPNRLVDYLVAHGVPKAHAVGMVESYLHSPGWQYGQRDPRLPKPQPKKPTPKNVTNRNVNTPGGNVYTTVPGDVVPKRSTKR